MPAFTDRAGEWYAPARSVGCFPQGALGTTQREESQVKRYMLLHVGFEKPTPEIMAAWGEWFEAVADKTVEHGGFHSGAREISRSGTMDLPMGMESITGYSIIEAESLDAAEEIARDNPFIASIRVYEITAQ